jgi:heptosyltransferase II
VTAALVLQTAWLGDVVLTTPLLSALAARGPVDVVTTPEAVPLLEAHPAVRAVLPFDKRGADRGPRGLLRTARRLRERRYDLAVLAQGSLRSGLLARAARIPRRVGFADEPAAFWCTERRARPAGHQAERLLALADFADGVNPAPHVAPLSLGLTGADHAAAEARLAAAGVAGRFVALAPGSARATKRWPFFGELAQALGPDVSVVVLGAQGDADLLASPSGPSLCTLPSARCTDLTGLPTRVSAAVIARAAAAVTNDSLALHLTQAVGTPVVALFGPTHPRYGFGPRGPRDVALGVELACRPCSPHGAARCPLGHHACLRTLDVAAVRAAVRHLTLAEETTCV